MKAPLGQAGLVASRESLDWAIQRDQTETADLLRKHGGKTSDWLKAEESIHYASAAGHIEAVKQHLAAGVDVNAKDDGWTPLHMAASREERGKPRRGTKEVVELLIAKGADVNAKDMGGWQNTAR